MSTQQMLSRRHILGDKKQYNMMADKVAIQQPDSPRLKLVTICVTLY